MFLESLEAPVPDANDDILAKCIGLIENPLGYEPVQHSADSDILAKCAALIQRPLGYKCKVLKSGQ